MLDINKVDKLLVNIQDIPLRHICSLFMAYDYPDYIYIKNYDREWYFYLDMEIYRALELSAKLGIDVILPWAINVLNAVITYWKVHYLSIISVINARLYGGLNYYEWIVSYWRMDSRYSFWDWYDFIYIFACKINLGGIEMDILWFVVGLLIPLFIWIVYKNETNKCLFCGNDAG